MATSEQAMMRMIKTRKRKPKEVVELVLPDGRQDEEQLNKHSSKREDACYH